MTTDETYLTGAEVREKLRISQGMLHVLRRAGKLRARRRGENGRYLFCASSVEEFLLDPAVPPPAPEVDDAAERGRAAKERLAQAMRKKGKK